MTKNFDVRVWELVDILIGRVGLLKRIDYNTPFEAERAIEYIQAALDEYKIRVKEMRNSEETV